MIMYQIKKLISHSHEKFINSDQVSQNGIDWPCSKHTYFEAINNQWENKMKN